jgi:hypothetical protein
MIVMCLATGTTRARLRRSCRVDVHSIAYPRTCTTLALSRMRHPTNASAAASSSRPTVARFCSHDRQPNAFAFEFDLLTLWFPPSAFSGSMSDRSDAESDTETPPAPPHRVAKTVRSALDLVVQSKGETGDFATFDSVELPLPGLTILPAPTGAASGGGQPMHVSLPLTTAQAVEIKARASRAPFGRGDKTLYDTAVRDTWQVNPDQISILNSAFHAAVRLVLVIVCGG